MSRGKTANAMRLPSWVVYYIIDVFVILVILYSYSKQAVLTVHAL